MKRALRRLLAVPNEPAYAADACRGLLRIVAFHVMDGTFSDGMVAGQAAVARAGGAADKNLEAWARSVMAALLTHVLQFDRAATEHARAVELARESGNTQRQASALCNLGFWQSAIGEYEAALRTFAAALALAESPEFVFLVRHNIIVTKRAARATVVDEEIAEAMRFDVDMGRVGDSYIRVLFRAESVSRLLETSRLAEAEKLAEQAAQIAVPAGRVAQTIARIAAAKCRCAREGDANALLAALDEVRALDNPVLLRDTLGDAIRIFEASNRLDLALALQHELLAHGKKHYFESARKALGRPSQQEQRGERELLSLEISTQRALDQLRAAAVAQGTRAGYDRLRPFRVSGLARRFAAELGWDERRAKALALAAKCMDLGNLVLSEDLLQKPRGLSTGERKIVAEHARFSAELLEHSRLAIVQACAPVVRFHHERFDGSGPWGLAGETIPVEARVLALVDAFDAMTHDRPWRPAYSAQKATRLIRELAGTQFDPALAYRFVDWMHKEYWSADDFDTHLADEAEHDDYLAVLARIDRLGAAEKPVGPRRHARHQDDATP